MAFEITHERGKCIGCGTCVAICPDNWEMKEDGKSSPKQALLEESGCNSDAEENCPVKIIHVKEV
ncbi:MAG: ferredoxin [Candidatus Diapherotrites archaeon]